MSQNAKIIRQKLGHLSPGPAYGVGLRKQFFDERKQLHGRVDFLEVVTENYMDFGGKPRAVLAELNEECPIIPHGVGLSIGSLDPLNEDYMKKLVEFLNWLQPVFFSDHLCASSAHQTQYHDLIPISFHPDMVRHVAERIDRVQQATSVPLLLENPSYYMTLPSSQMGESEFINEVVAASGCGLLLDVNNVYVNAVNHGYDPYKFIDSMPLDAVVQLHMAGHDDSGEFVVDTHGAPVRQEVHDLYRYTRKKLPDVWTLLEWDNDLPELSRVLTELDGLKLEEQRASVSATAVAAGPTQKASKKQQAPTPSPALKLMISP